MMYRSGGKPVAISSTRRIVRVTPEGGTSGYEPDVNPVIRIELSPSLGFLDTHQSYLSFRVKTKGDTVDHTKECRLDENCMSWVRDFTIYSSTGAVLENLQHYNLLVNLLHKATCPDDYKESIGKMIDNQGNRAVRNGAMAHSVGSVYNSGFDASGILGGKSNKMLPCGYFQGSLVIELTLAPMKDCFVYTDKDQTAKNGSYQIDNVEYHAHCLSFAEDYNAKFSQQLRERGVDISFDTFKTHNSLLSSKSMDLSISQNAASVKGVYHILRDKDKYQSPAYDSLSTYKSGNLEELQFDMGGKLVPEFPLKLKDDGITNMYSHNLQSWNMFRNLSLGCSVDDTNFASTEALKEPKGNVIGASYKAMPVRRVYGTWVCNGKEVYDETKYDVSAISADVNIAGDNATEAEIELAIETAVNKVRKQGRVKWRIADNDNVEFTHTVNTLSFVPDNVADIPLVEMGMRCKMGVGKAVTSEDSAVADTQLAYDSATSSYNNLSTTNVGLDRFLKTTSGKTDLANNTNLVDGSNVMYAGAPCQIAWAHTKGVNDDGTPNADGTARAGVCGLGVPFVDGQRRPILSKSAGFKQPGWVDIIPSDESFYIGCSFETHPEEISLVSGSDLTNSTPLHVRLRYSESAGDFYQPMDGSDPFTSFVHIDAVLRLTPSGELISSV